MRDIGPYKLISRLGAGGMAEVFLAIKPGPQGFEKQVALKRLLPALEDRDQYIRMLSEEARLHAQLDHPNIVPLLDFFAEGGTLCMAMEYVPGLHLRELAEKAQRTQKPIPWPLVVFIIAEALQGLDYAHKKKSSKGPLGIVHRDVSPQNILISYEGAVKVADFGIAWARTDREKTETGVLKGKIRYLSPEQIEGRPVDARTDIYGTGVLLYELLCGRHPFDGTTELEVLKKITAGSYPNPQPLASDLPPSLHTGITQALKLSPEERFADAASFRSYLLSLQPEDWRGVERDRLAELIAQIVPEKERRIVPLEKTEVMPKKETSPSKMEDRPMVRRTYLALLVLASILIVGSFFFEPASSPPENRETPPPSKAAKLPAPAIAKTSIPSPTIVPTEVRITEAATKIGQILVVGSKGTSVFVNGWKAGELPLKPLRLRPGDYFVVMSRPDGANSHQRVVVKPNRTARIGWKEKK